ncbi:MAG: transcription initiation factor IIB [Candidatus Bathyarchaeota archaeon]|nr:transcription initiation factor IIB [Candidatus Bathyarchaeota archaeon]
MKKKLAKQETENHGGCPQCGSRHWIEDHVTGEVACHVCGFVAKRKGTDMGPEWTKFSERESSRRRSGPPQSILYNDLGLSTVILEPHKSKSLPRDAKNKISRMRRFDLTTKPHPTEARNLRVARHLLEHYGDKLHLSTYVMARAMHIYRKALDKGLIKGRAIRNIMAAATYYACRLTNTPRDLKQIEAAYPVVAKNVVARDYRLLMRHLKIRPPVADPAIHVRKIASKLDLDEKTIEETLSLLEDGRKTGFIYGKGPVGIAGAALYLVCKKRRPETSQWKIAKAARVTEVTIRSRSKDLEKNLTKEKMKIVTEARTQ